METQDIFIVRPKTEEEVSALKAFMKALKIKFEVSKKQDYNPEFLAKIAESKKQYEDGDFISVEKGDIKNFLGLE